ncbi:hypothetical protein OLEAN_C08880 [Oleispira antarctica RB-8]|uniref:Uncharacterized protein n=1 Tax=Oleispira antarctica RB-8 TaxID=698738 RepID=R4YSH0_OLEAN|nr:hypothetical protein OLEAN_C08880 [Oleispira antarctica RB-8]
MQLDESYCIFIGGSYHGEKMRVLDGDGELALPPKYEEDHILSNRSGWVPLEPKKMEQYVRRKVFFRSRNVEVFVVAEMVIEELEPEKIEHLNRLINDLLEQQEPV